MLVRLRNRCFCIAGGGEPEDECGVDRRRMPHGERNITRTVRHGMCAGSRIAEGSQSVDDFGDAELDFEFADAILHTTLEVLDDGRTRGVAIVDRFESKE
jgi:hypothetical protein